MGARARVPERACVPHDPVGAGRGSGRSWSGCGRRWRRRGGGTCGRRQRWRRPWRPPKRVRRQGWGWGCATLRRGVGAGRVGAGAGGNDRARPPMHPPAGLRSCAAAAGDPGGPPVLSEEKLAELRRTLKASPGCRLSVVGCRLWEGGEDGPWHVAGGRHAVLPGGPCAHPRSGAPQRCSPPPTPPFRAPLSRSPAHTLPHMCDHTVAYAAPRAGHMGPLCPGLHGRRGEGGTGGGESRLSPPS
jgi:hypothetical protein